MERDEVYPSFYAIHGRKPEAGRDYDPDGPLCQDDYEYYTGTGRYADSSRGLDGFSAWELNGAHVGWGPAYEFDERVALYRREALATVQTQDS
jgi:hypothetical protein